MQKADAIISGGKIFSGLAEGFVEALAIGGDRIPPPAMADVEALRGPTRMIDLAGRVAIPGLNDAHMHLMMVGLGMQEVDLRPPKRA